MSFARLLGLQFSGFFVSKCAAQYFAYHGLGQLFTEFKNAGDFVGGKLLTAEGRQFGYREFFSGLGNDIGFKRFAA